MLDAVLDAGAAAFKTLREGAEPRARETDEEDFIPASDADLEQCANENIHSPGAIQPHGGLLAVDPRDLRIIHASANAGQLTGFAVPNLLGRPLSDIFAQEICDRIAHSSSTDQTEIGTAGWTLRSSLPGQLHSLQIHRTADFIVIEFEPFEDIQSREDAFDCAQSLITRLRAAGTLEELCDGVARQLRQFTGYDRVMVYRFDDEGHGEIIAESKIDEIEPYLGLRYPASDIPAQARRLYLLARTRVIGTVRYKPVPLLSLGNERGATSLDMSQCTLRSVSPIHLEYLRNMGAEASLTVSIIQDQRLWGMVVCHHGRPRVPRPAIRVFCNLVGQLLGLLIAEVDERQRLFALVERNRLLTAIANSVSASGSLVEGIQASVADLLAITRSTGLLVRLDSTLHCFGKTPEPDTAHALLDAVLAGNADDIPHHATLGEAGLIREGARQVASGILAFRIADSAGDCIAWVRPEVVQTVRWGGNPDAKALLQKTTGRLTPRHSFAAWQQTFHGRSMPWSANDMKAARDLRRLLTRALLRYTEMKLFRMTNTDPLTSLANRNVLVQRIEEWRRAEASSHAALMFIDLDRFKIVNDSLGHYAGDELLQEVSSRILAVLGRQHMLARLGGDEFVIFSPDISLTRATDLADAVVGCFVEPFSVLGRPYRTSTSVGLVHTDEIHADLLSSADAAMYAAKRKGGNCFAIFEKGLQRTVEVKRKIEQDLFQALRRDELTVAYQPVMALPSGKLIGFEALARWQHAELGSISPAEFIPIAEESGQIGRLGHWVASCAIERLGRCADRSLYLTINVSGRQLSTGRFCDEVTSAMLTCNVAPARVTFEVTESVLMDDHALRELARLRALGCRVAIDDFGTGYSSLAYLRRLPVDVIKIDRSFVTPLGEDEDARSFLAALISLIRTLGLDIIAEGIETEEQRAILQALGVGGGQGYLFGKPAADMSA